MMNNIIHFSDSNKKKNPAELWIENRIYFSAIPSFVNGSMSVTFFNKTCHMICLNLKILIKARLLYFSILLTDHDMTLTWEYCCLVTPASVTHWTFCHPLWLFTL